MHSYRENISSDRMEKLAELLLGEQLEQRGSFEGDRRAHRGRNSAVSTRNQTIDRQHNRSRTSPQQNDSEDVLLYICCFDRRTSSLLSTVVVRDTSTTLEHMSRSAVRSS